MKVKLLLAFIVAIPALVLIANFAWFAFVGCGFLPAIPTTTPEMAMARLMTCFASGFASLGVIQFYGEK